MSTHRRPGRKPEILRRMVRGEKVREIAFALFVSEKTIKWHMTEIYRNEGITGPPNNKRKRLIEKYAGSQP